jgi:hypothetical protein
MGVGIELWLKVRGKMKEGRGKGKRARDHGWSWKGKRGTGGERGEGDTTVEREKKQFHRKNKPTLTIDNGFVIKRISGRIKHNVLYRAETDSCVQNESLSRSQGAPPSQWCRFVIYLTVVLLRRVKRRRSSGYCTQLWLGDC